MENSRKTVDVGCENVDNLLANPQRVHSTREKLLCARSRAQFFPLRAANDIIASLMSKLSFLLILLVALALVLGGVGLGSAYFETKTLQGTVIDSSGAPLAQAAITLAGRSTFSNHQGYFEIQFPRGAYQVRAFADRFQSSVQLLDAQDFFKQTFSIQLTLEPQVWRARVVDAQNKPIANAQVEINGETLTTNAQGEFTARYVRSGAKFKISAPGYHTLGAIIQTTGSGDQATTLQLTPVELRVVVVDATSNQPLPGVRVSANGAHVNTDANGAVVLLGLAVGTPISAQAPGYANATIKVDGTVQMTLPLQPTTLRGRFVDPNTKQAVPNAIVILGAPGKDAPMLQTDANGIFALDDFRKVSRVYVKKPGYALGVFDLKQGGKQDFALTPLRVKGIHLYYGITRADAERVLAQFKNTEMNAVVFDVKEDPGYILWDSPAPLAKKIGAYVTRDYTAQDQVAACRAYKLYCIARMTVFKDVLLAKKRADLALHDTNGNLLYENSAYWTDPAEKEVQDYHIALAQELAAMGFDEIQFDYIRYPGSRDVNAAEFGDADYRVSTIVNFSQRAADALRPTAAFFSGDVFGLTTATTDEQGIGQVWEKTVGAFDYISPMMYPSTWRYATDLWGASFGIKTCTDAYACPYDILRYGTLKAQARTPNNWTRVRPWLQAYQMGLADMLKQSQGADDANGAGYLFWNNQGIYPNGLFKKK
ncbi:MAG: carboxypeptidase regulatory-like domain-containing protein [Chloroflexi bacterium]|nr:carboxypeptidase regulatory-like domain-containing protein [Chloroflexota bacterium]